MSDDIVQICQRLEYRLGQGALDGFVDPRRIDGAKSPELKGGAIERDSNAVDLHRTQDGFRRQWEQPELAGIAKHEQVGGDRIAQQGKPQTSRIDRVVIAGHALQPLEEQAFLEVHVGVALE